MRAVSWIALALGAAALAVILFATEAGARLWLAVIEDHSPLVQKEEAAGAQAIVVLGGNRDRVHEAARLHSLTGLPILLSGKGTGDSGYAAESEKMAEILRKQHGMEPRWLETRSRNTYENAVETWCILRPQGIVRVVLVTGAQHMVRARYEFRRVGFDVVPDPVSERPRMQPLTTHDFAPDAAGMRSVGRALGEYRDLAFAIVADLLGPAPRCGTGAAPDYGIIPNRTLTLISSSQPLR